jgi:hypothetical protein
MKRTEEIKSEEEEDDEEDITEISFDYLFGKISTICVQENKKNKEKRKEDDEIEKRKEDDEIELVCLWMVKRENNNIYEEKELSQSASSVMSNSNEDEEDDGEDNSDPNNILKALLKHKKDDLCLKYMGYYKNFLQEDLFLYSLKQLNK